MGEDVRTQIEELLSNPEMLILKKPFTRGADRQNMYCGGEKTAQINEAIKATLPKFKKRVVTQEQFARELDPACHDVLFDDNLPSLCVKVNDGGYVDIKFERQALPIQENIKNKQLMHLTGNKMSFTMIDTNPTDVQREDFIVFKQYWDKRNQDGMKTKMVDAQLSYGEGGLLYYFDYNGSIKSRLISYKDGYVLIPHNDKNGDRILDCIYYEKDGVEYIDCYDATYMTRWTKDNDTTDENNGWVRHEAVVHGFKEIPIVTKWGDVAWGKVQNLIESYEVLFNIFNAIQRRFGWGILYIKGKFKDQAQKINGSVVLNDSSIDGKGDAKYLTPPTPDGMLDTMKSIFKSIQIGSSTTFLMPEDINMSGDISGIAVQLTLSQDNELAARNVIEWQNVADKMVRLFKYGLSVELVNEGINPTAITEFENLNINAKFKVWRPFSETEYNQMLISLVGSGILSKESGIELNTASKPDEKARIEKEEKEKRELEATFVDNVTIQEDVQNQTTTTSNGYALYNNNNTGNNPIN